MSARPSDLSPEQVVAAVDALLAGPRPLPIVQAGDPVLRQVATPWTGQLDPVRWAALLEAMRLTMHAAPGVGLAAPQVGLSLAVAVVEDQWGFGDDEDPEDDEDDDLEDDDDDLDDEDDEDDEDDDDDARERTPVPFRVLVNPRYEPVGGEQVSFYEGCLSVSGFQAVRTRPRAVRLVCTDHTGAQVDEVLTGWPARIVQHETDHLNGELYLDRAELRSLLAPDHAMRYADQDVPRRASAELGFPLA